MNLIIVAFYTFCDNFLIQNGHTWLLRIVHSNLGYWEILISL